MSYANQIDTVQELQPEASRNPRPPIEIGVMGTPVASGNRGVLALGAALTKLCMEVGHPTSVVLFGSHRDNRPIIMRPIGKDHAIPMVHWRMSPKGGLRYHLLVIVLCSFIYRCIPFRWLRNRLGASIPWIAALQRCQFVGDIRGGDSFSDIYGLERFLTATLPILSVIWVKGSIVLFPQTYGPYKSPVARWIARWIIRHSSVVIARDKASQAVAQSLAGSTRNVSLSPDVAFALHADLPRDIQLDGRNAPLPKNPIGLNVNGLMFNGGYTGKNMFGLKLEYRSFLIELVNRLLREQTGDVLLVPHTYEPIGHRESDNDACAQLKASMSAELQPRIKVITGEYDAHQLKGIIGQCNFFVGARMHSCIAALSQGVPCVGIAYSMKFRGVFESVGVADWVVDGRLMETGAAIDAVSALYHRREETRQQLGQNAEAARGRLERIFTSLVSTGSLNPTELKNGQRL